MANHVPDRAGDSRRRPQLRTFEDLGFNAYQGEGPQRISDLPKEERDLYRWETKPSREQ